MKTAVNDSVIDELQIVWEESPRYSGPKIVSSPSELRVIQDFLSTSTWQSHIRFITPGVLNQYGCVIEYSGFMFPEDISSAEEPFEGVMMFDPLDTIYLSKFAFDKLMNRYFQAIIESVINHQRNVISEGWWKEFVGMAEQLRERVKQNKLS